MRGIVLAGGTGSRLGVVTKVFNKHVLPVGGESMIYWPLKVLHDNGIDDITIVSTPQGVGQLATILGGEYTYRVQDKPGGIAQALACANDWSSRSVAVILGDNVFLPTPKIYKSSVASDIAQCYLYQSPRLDLTQFGVARFTNGAVTQIQEKPSVPPSKYAVTGLYAFGCEVFDVISEVNVSKRGEYEITDVLNKYAAMCLLRSMNYEGFWGDAGTHEGITECSAAIKAARNT